MQLHTYKNLTNLQFLDQENKCKNLPCGLLWTLKGVEQNKMSAKILSSLSDDNRDLRKQIGCINIYKLFYRNNFPAGWRGGQQQKTLPAPVEHDKVDNIHDARRKSVMQNGQPETPSQRKNSSNSESQSQRATTRRKQQSITKGLQSPAPDIRDVVKDSMHREARSLPIKFRATDDSKVTLMKYVDSPRPLQQYKLRRPAEATFYQGSKVQERVKITKHRSSFDERDSRETMKLRELPRLSLDSRASALRSALLDQRMDMESAGNHARSSSIIVKLMGLDAFPDTIPTPENRITTTKVSQKFHPEINMTTQETTQQRTSVSQPVSQKNHASSSPRLHHGGPTTCSKVPMESVPWRQRDCSQGSPRVAAQSRKVLANGQDQSYSVYGEIEKRITELQFRRSGKDLRALKQILQSTQNANGGVENQTRKPSEFILHRRNSLDRNSDLAIWQNKRAYQQVPSLKGTLIHKPSVSSLGGKKSNMKEKVKKSCSTMESVAQRETIQELKYKSQNPEFRERTKDVIPSWRLSSIDKKFTWRNLEAEQILGVSELKLKNCTTSGRGMEMASPRLQTNVLKIRGEFSTTTPSLDTGRAKKHSSKKVGEESSRSRRVVSKSSDIQLSDDQLSELSNETRCSCYQGDTASVKSEGNKSVASQMEREVISCLSNSINTNPREQNSVTTSEESLQSLERETNMLEQPSPVSVLDNTFYNEDSPSPVAKISTVFGEDERHIPEEEWHHESLRHLKEFKEYNPKSENLLFLACERTLLGTEPSENAASTNGSLYMSLDQQQCISEALRESGDLKDTIINPKSYHLLSSWHPTNSKMFNAHEEMEDNMEAEKAELAEKIHKKYFDQNIQRKVVLEMANDILSRKITRGGLFTTGKKKTSVDGLMKEICSEIDHLCSMPYCNLDDDDDDGLNRLLTADMKYESDDWTDHDSEVPYLVLDIERRIFKDLIHEVVTGEVMSLHDCPKRTCRKLFN